jgi:hypothetical protein
MKDDEPCHRLTWARLQRLIELLVSAIGPVAKLIAAIARLR